MDITTLALAKNLIKSSMGDGIRYEKISNLPEKGEKGVIYFLTRDDGSFSEYMYIDETWELLGSSGEVSLSWDDLTDKPFGEEIPAGEEPDVMLYASDKIYSLPVTLDWNIVPSEKPYLISIEMIRGYFGKEGSAYIKLKITRNGFGGYRFEIINFDTDNPSDWKADEFIFSATEDNKLQITTNPNEIIAGHYFTLYGYGETIYTTLDDKYISDNIARVEWVESQIGNINSILATLSNGGVE